MPKTSTTFKPGEGGRKKGVPNKLTQSVKETVLAAFQDLQDDKTHNLVAFAKKHPRDFYQIAAKLIPTEVKGNVKSKIFLEIVRKQKNNTGAE